MFTNRTSAGKQLAVKVEAYVFEKLKPGTNPDIIVVGRPRGGVPVALQVARHLKCPLEVMVSKKIPFPGQPEYAIGAVTSDGDVVLSPEVPQDRKWKSYLDEQSEMLLQQTRASEEAFYAKARRSPTSFSNKLVIMVDDGVATGMTVLAAVETAKRRGAASIVVAAPVMSPESFRQLSHICDGVVSMVVPTDFRSVGQYYFHFEQTSNEDVVDALKNSLAPPVTSPTCSDDPMTHATGSAR